MYVVTGESEKFFSKERSFARQCRQCRHLITQRMGQWNRLRQEDGRKLAVHTQTVRNATIGAIVGYGPHSMYS